MVFPVETRASSVASFTRWASPPERVVLDCPQLYIAKTDLHQSLGFSADLRQILEEIHRFLRGEILVECLLSDKLLCLKMQGALSLTPDGSLPSEIVLLRLSAGRDLDQTLI